MMKTKVATRSAHATLGIYYFTSKWDIMRSLLVERRLVGRVIRRECSSRDPCMRSIVVASDLQGQSRQCPKCSVCVCGCVGVGLFRD